jgi:uncharacterized integral membrane protein
MSFNLEPTSSDGGSKGGEKSKVPLIVAWAILAVAAIAFVVQNHDRVSFQFLFFDFRWPLWTMLVVFFLLGLVTGLIVARRPKKPAA